jgi:hypothetical protein
VSSGGEHNIVAHCTLDVTGYSGYARGPRGFQANYSFGGIYVHAGTIHTFRQSLKMHDYSSGYTLASPVASSIRGRPSQAGPAQDEMIAQAKSWYMFCATSHTKCLANQTSRFFPKRVLDLDTHGRIATARLWTVPKGFRGRYVTLSYC